MDVEILFAGVAVSDFPVSQSWYERFFARRADVIAHETEVMWQVTEHGWLYIVRDAAHAGSSLATMAVSDIEKATSELEVWPLGRSRRRARPVARRSHVIRTATRLRSSKSLGDESRNDLNQ